MINSLAQHNSLINAHNSELNVKYSYTSGLGKTRTKAA